MAQETTPRKKGSTLCLALMGVVGVGGLIWTVSSDLWLLSLAMVACVEYMLYVLYVLVSGQAAERLGAEDQESQNGQSALFADGHLDSSTNHGPLVNLDGTPMRDDGFFDIESKPFGVTSDYD